MDNNYKQKNEKEETTLEILRNLLEAMPLEKLEKQVSIRRSTLFKYLTLLEKEGLIERIFQEDKRKRIYKTTSKGTSLLGELDNETRNQIFTHEVFRDIINFISFFFLRNPNCLNERTFYESLERRIGEAVLFTAIKQLEEPAVNPIEMKDLAGMFSKIFKPTRIPPKRLKTLIGEKTLINRLESHYSESRKITPENYKKMVAVDYVLTKMIKSMSDDEKEEAINILKKTIDKIMES